MLKRAGDGCVGRTGVGVLEHLELGADFRQQRDAAIFGQHRQEVLCLPGSPAT